MKKKISLLVILAAVLALSSCVIIDGPEYAGTLNVYIDSNYQDYYYIGTVYIKENGNWVEVWDAEDHDWTYSEGVHLNLEEGWYDFKFDAYKSGHCKDYFYTDYIRNNVYIRAGHATNYRFGRNGLTKK